MKLYAISDLHLDYAINREALQALPSHPEDWLILGGDLGHTEDDLHFALRLLTQRFQRLFWVPGNHDLWTLPNSPSRLHGKTNITAWSPFAEYGVATPEILTCAGQARETPVSSARCSSCMTTAFGRRRCR